MERNKFDLIIPVVYKDYGMLDRVLQYVVKYISPDNIYIITDARYRKYLPKEARRMEVVDENVLLPGLSFFRIKEPAQTKWQRGWPSGVVFATVY